MLGNLTMTKRRVAGAALRAQLASFEGMALYRRDHGLSIDKERAQDIETLKNLLAHLG